MTNIEQHEIHFQFLKDLPIPTALARDIMSALMLAKMDGATYSAITEDTEASIIIKASGAAITALESRLMRLQRSFECLSILIIGTDENSSLEIKLKYVKIE
jgi:hypothetical protein